MPQCLQNVCFAVRVLNSYVVSSSLPLRSSKRSGGTIRCRIPFLVHIEQLQSVTRSRSAVIRNRTRPQWQPPSIVLSMVVTFEITLPACVDLIFRSLAEQTKLRGIARRLGKTEMAEGVRRQQPTARSALEETALDQERLYNFLDCVARFRQRRRHGFDSNRTTAIVLSDRGEVAPVHGIEPGGIDLELDQCTVGSGSVDCGSVCDQRKVTHPAQQPAGDARRAARTASDLVRAVGGHANAEHTRAAVDDLFELALGIKIASHWDAKAAAQGVGGRPGAR